MKKSTLIIIFVSIGFVSAIAQDSLYQDKKTELGVRMSDFNDFGFIYKKEKDKNKFLRIRASGFNFGYINSSALIGLQTALGKEKRNIIGERLQFIHGPELSLAITYSSEGGFTSTISNGFFGGNTEIFISSGENNLLFTPAIGYILGFQYEINDKFLFSLETIPSFQLVLYSGMDNPIFNLGFNSQAVAITFAYSFYRLKKK